MTPEDAALEVWDLEFTHGRTSAKNAMTSAVQAALATAQRKADSEARDRLLSLAEEIDNDDDNDLNEDGPAALVYAASLLDASLPPELRLENNDA